MRFRFALSVVSVASATLACSILVGGPEYPKPPGESSTQAVEAAQTQIAQAVLESAQTGAFRLVISQSQLTAYLASQLDGQSTMISDPQVELTNGVIHVYGTARSGIFIATMDVTAQVTLDDQGQPQIEIVKADFGPVPMPDALASSLSSVLQEALTGSLGPAATGFRLDSVDIADGTMTITGRTK
ncbi:MAG: LmeA family phospholipid-binding protein [Anaerolineales bacterium]